MEKHEKEQNAFDKRIYSEQWKYGYEGVRYHDVFHKKKKDERKYCCKYRSSQTYFSSLENFIAND